MALSPQWYQLNAPDSKGYTMTVLSFIRMIPVFALLLALPAAAATRFEPPVPDLPDYSFRYDEARDPAADLLLARAAALQKHRRVLVMVGGDWCVWCFLLDRQLDLDRASAAVFYSGFEVLRVYYNDDNKNRAFLAQFPDFTMFPHFFVVDPDGRVAGSVVADALIRDAKYDAELIRRFAEQWRLP
jgi:thiol:disulfide interchange protein